MSKLLSSAEIETHNDEPRRVSSTIQCKDKHRDARSTASKEGENSARVGDEVGYDTAKKGRDVEDDKGIVADAVREILGFL